MKPHFTRTPDGFRYAAPSSWPGAGARMWDWRALLPVALDIEPVTLGEGGTPLVAASRERGCRLFWKNEGVNPTGSQKDRAISVVFTHARAIGARRVALASTGSVGVACAAYAARARVPCVVLMPRGTPAERMAPMLALGATVVAMDATFVEIERLLGALDESWYQASTIAGVNPWQAGGPKTIAYEIVAQLGRAPDWVVVPVGGGGTLAAIGTGFAELREFGRIDRLPRLVAVQSATFNALEIAMARGLTTMAELETIAADERLETIARNLKHGVPPDAPGALAALRACNGLALSIEEDEIRRWHLRLAGEEGIFAEPSSAVTPAAVERLVGDGTIRRDDVVVGVITGSGFREIGALPRAAPHTLPASATPADLETLLSRKGTA